VSSVVITPVPQDAVHARAQQAFIRVPHRAARDIMDGREPAKRSADPELQAAT
jgi:hypothetical protein